MKNVSEKNNIEELKQHTVSIENTPENASAVQLEQITEELLNFQTITEDKFETIANRYNSLNPTKKESITATYGKKIEAAFDRLSELIGKGAKKVLPEGIYNALENATGALSRRNEKTKQVKFAGTGEFEKKLTDEELRNLPQTLNEIKKLPKAEKFERMKDFQETLSWYQFTVAQKESAVIDRILINPDVDVDSIAKIITKEFDGLPIQEGAEEHAQDIAERYVVRHQKVEQLRKEFPKDADLFEELIGVQPKGKVEIRKTPINFFIRAHNLEDYAQVYSLGGIEGNQDRILEQKEIMEAGKSGGVKINVARHKELEGGGIIAENARQSRTREERERIFKHEQQHAMHDFFEKGRTAEWITNMWFSSNFLSVEKKEEVKPIIESLYRIKLREMETGAKDEILAYMIEGPGDFHDIQKILLDENGLYNYLKDERDVYTSIPFEQDWVFHHDPQSGKLNENGERRWSEFEQGIIQEYQRVVPELEEKIYKIQYREHVKNAIYAVYQMHEAGIPKNLILRVLTHEPLDKWPRMADRFLEKSNK